MAEKVISGRLRSSTSASHKQSENGQHAKTARLVHQLSFDDLTMTEIDRLSGLLAQLRDSIHEEAGLTSTFRHEAGFERLLLICAALRSISVDSATVLESACALLCDSLLVLKVALHESPSNVRYFHHRLRGWESIQTCLQNVQDSAMTLLDKDGESAIRRLYRALHLLAIEADHLDLGEQSFLDSKDLVRSAIMSQPQAYAILLPLGLKFATGANEDSPLVANVIHYINFFSSLLEQQPHLQAAMHDTNLQADLLRHVDSQVIPPSLMDAFEDLTLRLSEMGFLHLDNVEQLFRKTSHSSLSRKVLSSAIKASKQPSCIQFDLSVCGFSSLELATLPRQFPPLMGYTLTLWCRVDEFDDSSHTTLFGAFDASQTCFVLLYLERDTHQLILQTSIRSARPSVRFKSFEFHAERWYHIAIVQDRTQTDAQNSRVALFVDGDFVEQTKCAYPDNPAPATSKNESSSKSYGSMPRAGTVQAFFGTPHDLARQVSPGRLNSRWSLAAAHLIGVSVSDELIAVYHKLGPRYLGNFQDCLGPLLTYQASAQLNRYNELLHPDRSEKSEIIMVTEQRGSEVLNEGKILIAVNATNVHSNTSMLSEEFKVINHLDSKAQKRVEAIVYKTNGVVVNGASPCTNEAISRSFGLGVLTGRTNHFAPRALDHSIWSLCGAIPILIRMLEAANTKSAFLQASQIFFDCIKDDWRISEAMEKGNGFGMLAIVIRDKLGIETSTPSATTSRRPAFPLAVADRVETSMVLLRLILAFVGLNSERPQDSLIINPMAYRVLLVDFDTWRRCDLVTQVMYYQQFAVFTTNNLHHAFNQKRLMRMRVARKLFEALKHEEMTRETLPLLLDALNALLSSTGSWVLYREFAMFITFALQDGRAFSRTPQYNKKNSMFHKLSNGSQASRDTYNNIVGEKTPDLGASMSKCEMALPSLTLLVSLVCDSDDIQAFRRFYDSKKGVPSRWTLHLLAESDPKIISLAMRMICDSLAVLGAEHKASFVAKNAGFITLKSRLKSFWREETIWLSSFAILFGQRVAIPIRQEFSVHSLMQIFRVSEGHIISVPEMLSPLIAMLEAGLRSIVRDEDSDTHDSRIIRTVIHFLNELHSRSAPFREFAAGSKYMQELLFVLYPVLVGSDRLAAELELSADKDQLSFRGEEVTMRPHANSIGARPPSIRSLGPETERRPSSVRSQIARPRRLSSFVLIGAQPKSTSLSPLQFQPALLPKSKEPVKMNVGNSTVESLLELVTTFVVDLICNRRDFYGIGLFMKVPPGFREHQAYFESYVLVHIISQLWSHLQLNQRLLTQTKVLTNLSKFCQHLAEALFEGWFVDGGHPILDFTGKLLEYMQQSDIAAMNDVRLCSHQINAIRLVFLRVTLWRLAELDESVSPDETVAFLDQMNYWQTILFSDDNKETLFIRLMCFVLYMKLRSEVKPVRLAAASLWRTILVQKSGEAATLLTFAAGSDQRHLATEFMGLVSLEDEEIITWIDSNHVVLDVVFVDHLKKSWDDFVADENRRNEETARARLAKRREKLRQWQSSELTTDDALQRYETATNHWRSNIHSQERLRLQRALQDHQESVSHLYSVFSEMEKTMRRPSGISPVTGEIKWRLDETEAANRMRMRVVPDPTQRTEDYRPKRRGTTPKVVTINTQVARMGNSISSAFPATPSSPFPAFEEESENGNGDTRADSASNSQLLEGAFEIVDDPNEGDDGLVEDKNRKILTSLQRGDECQQLHNISRIIGLEAVEGLLIIGKRCLYIQDGYFQRSDGEIIAVSQASADERDPYVQLISGKDIGQNKAKTLSTEQETRYWTWREVLSISKRRFLFRDVSVEVFFTDGRSYLLTSMSTKIRDELFNAIVSRAPHVHGGGKMADEDAWRLNTLRNPEEAPQSLGTKFASVFNAAPAYAVTKKWIRGDMSNFQYLMLINTMAGRTFNDLTQYPVFPWILADYTSSELDLDDPRSFRDLSKPMGCQSPQREAEFRDRYKQFADMGDENAPSFHYGTHYSSAMIVSSYLIRLQPFVQSYLLLQGGHFDHADRLFDSIEKAWLSASKETMSDVRELTPEFFYLPEFLNNVNGYDFGVKQGSDEKVDHVRLPPWAKGDPQLFIAKHREALESPYVSEHLHHWVDLIFGYKQRGEAAIEAANVFQHLSYGGARDLDAINDPVERLASIGIIHSFGQTPHQIFHRPHPAREVSMSGATRMDRSAENLIRLPEPLFNNDERVASLAFSSTYERLLCAGPGKLILLPNSDRHLQWGFTDHSIRFYSSNTKRLLGLFENIHIGPITTACLADSKTLITGGVDCTIGVWTIHSTLNPIELQPKTYLFGHRAVVSILSVSRICSTMVSASRDGQVLIWGLNRLQCIRQLHAAGTAPIQQARISDVTGHIAVCQGADLLLYTINGVLLVRQRICETADETVTSCAFFEGNGSEWLEREVIFTGHRQGVVNVWTLTNLTDGAWHLQLIKRMNHTDVHRKDGGNAAASITAILPMRTSVYTGDEEGRVWQWDCVQRATSLPRR